MGKKTKAPKTPDYQSLAKTQGEEDRKTAAEITKWNRPTQVDSMGNSVTWEMDPSGNWTQKQTFTPEVQQQFNTQTTNANAAGDLYSQLLRQVSGQGAFQAPDMPTYDANSGREVADATYGLLTDRLIPHQARQSDQLNTRMRLQGLAPGAQAYDDTMKDLTTSQGDVLTGAANQATVTGYDEARQRYLAQLQGQNQEFGQSMAEYTMPWQQMTQAATLAGDRYMPTMPGFSGATGYNPSDIVGAANAKYNAKMGEYNAGQSKKGGLMNTAGTLGAAAIKASDSSLKYNIEPLDGQSALEALLKIGGYRYQWVDSNEVDLGVLAQEVEKVLPELINRDEEFLKVNYTGIVALAIEAIKHLNARLAMRTH